MGTAETVHHEEALAAELLLSQLLDRLPGLHGHLVVVVGIPFGGPPDFTGLAFLGSLVVHNVLVFGGTAGIDTRHHVDGAQLGHLTLIKTFETGLGLFVVKHLIRRVVEDFLDSLDPVLLKIDVCHYLKIFRNYFQSTNVLIINHFSKRAAILLRSPCESVRFSRRSA